jgi:hypothetical protein
VHVAFLLEAFWRRNVVRWWTKSRVFRLWLRNGLYQRNRCAWGERGVPIDEVVRILYGDQLSASFAPFTSAKTVAAPALDGKLLAQLPVEGRLVGHI